MAQLTIATDERDLAAHAAARVTELVEQAVSARGTAAVSLTGGTTPRQLYAGLADAGQPWRGRIPWPQLQLFWGDERHVPPDHPDSNYGMARTALLDRVPIPAARVHRIQGEMPDARAAAADYERTLDALSGTASADRDQFLFDLMLLGVGADAHIASIFPGSELLHPGSERRMPDTRVAAVRVPDTGAWRVTLTPAAILDSKAILVLVAGGHKSTAVHSALEAPLDVRRYPAQLLRSAGDRVEWLCDRSAAQRL